MAKTKTGYGASRATYMGELVSERLTGNPYEGFQSAAMRFGTDNEPLARGSYEFYRDIEVREVGFIDHPSIPMCGASPDGMVGTDGLIEIKVPNTITHIDTLLGSPVDQRYLYQMQFQMAVTSRLWCDYVSFDPRMPVRFRMHVRRIERDRELILEIESEVLQFLEELQEKLKRLEEFDRNKPRPIAVPARTHRRASVQANRRAL
jgi:predicted phage-related endonuclease